MLRAVRAIMDAGIALPLRVGVNCGPVFSGDFGPSYRRTFSVKGDAVNLAARLMGKADTGEIVASDDVVRRSRTVFALEQLEPFFVKGKSAAIRAHMVGDVVGRFGVATGTPLVGREDELGQLQRALDVGAGLARPPRRGRRRARPREVAAHRGAARECRGRHDRLGRCGRVRGVDAVRRGASAASVAVRSRRPRRPRGGRATGGDSSTSSRHVSCRGCRCSRSRSGSTCRRRPRSTA